MLCEQEFTQYLTEVYCDEILGDEDLNNNLTDQEKMLAVILVASAENDLPLDINQIPALKEVAMKIDKIQENEFERQIDEKSVLAVNKQAGKGLER